MRFTPQLAGIVTIVLFFSSCLQEKDALEAEKTLDYSGPYIGQTVPGDSAELFAPGFVSTSLFTRDITMTPDGDEIYFCISASGYNLIYTTRQLDGVWTKPEVASFVSDPSYMYYEPHLTADGKSLYFLSNMPVNKTDEASEDIWAVDREKDGWGEPYNLGAPVNTDGSEFYPTLTNDGTLYFTRAEKGSRVNQIYRARKVDGQYRAAELLGPEVNCGTNRYNAFIDPQERFIIVPAIGMEDSRGGTDYYISFRDEDDKWSAAVNMGDKINSDNGREYSASLSPDGKYFFFMSAKVPETVRPDYQTLLDAAGSPWNGTANIYWIKSDFIWDLKNN